MNIWVWCIQVWKITQPTIFKNILIPSGGDVVTFLYCAISVVIVFSSERDNILVVVEKNCFSNMINDDINHNQHFKTMHFIYQLYKILFRSESVIDLKKVLSPVSMISIISIKVLHYWRNSNSVEPQIENVLKSGLYSFESPSAVIW